jgi:hypothetical protein
VRHQALVVLAGPLALLRGAPAKAGLLVLLVLLLTLTTQIGGVVLWFCVPVLVWVGRRLDGRKSFLRVGAGIGIYLCAYFGVSLAVVPLAGAFGRAPLSCGLAGEAVYGPRTIWTCLLNRHYAVLPARQALQRVSDGFSREYKGSRIAYLDAGFPFFAWFPMFPHISHADGRKIDLALFYTGGAASSSPIGYWGFVRPRDGDPQPCKGREGWLRWDMAWLQPLFQELPLDELGTRALLVRLAAAPAVRRILVEPHLRARLGLDHSKLRFQGCAAARHDDHVHVEF